MRCEKCGSEIPENSKFCNSCGAEQPQEVIPTIDATEIEMVEAIVEVPVESPPEIFVPLEEPNPFTENQPSATKEKFYKKSWFIALMLFLFFPVGAYLMWKEKKFNKVVRIISSIILGLNFIFWTFILIVLLLPCSHEWIDATCSEPKTCSICLETEGEPLGHIKGEWKLTKEATLVDVGVEELLCDRCNEALDSRGTEKKHPKIKGSSFNFEDEEFIEWINELSTLEVDTEDLEIASGSENTSYRITAANDEKGAFILHHDNNDNIDSIMVYFEDINYATAIAVWIGEKIDSDFSSDDVIDQLYIYDYCTDEGMTVLLLELDTDFEVAVLAPEDFFDEILD